LGEEAIPTSPSEEKARRITISWSRENPEETALAEKKFNKYIRKGWVAFVVTSDNRNIQVFKFDPKFEKVHLAPTVEGG
jgi:hypothetical protein